GWFEEMEAMTTADFERGWGKIWLENLTLAANRPRLREQYIKVSTMIRELHERRVRDMLERLGIDDREFPAAGIVTLLDAINYKLILDRLVGIDAGHRELVEILGRIRGQLEQAATSELAR
ncbi:MAG TPA: hypothetical protein VEP49_19685, partial [Acidimicrobiia bacterium]|nr:hypothetical protein [Acidimicrobiia bacterium]